MENGKIENLGIVITGGSRGLGYALAKGFLSVGDRVVICARNPEGVDSAVSSLRQSVPDGKIFGISCDVTNPEDACRLASFAVSVLGSVDRWLNNAGTSGHRKRPLWELDERDLLETCTTNLYGSMLMSKTAVGIMRLQPAKASEVYHIFNFGFTSFGARFSRSPVPHKASKTGVAAITRHLSREIRQAEISGIGVHEVSPGLVLTDLLLRDTDDETRAFLQITADTPEVVAQRLVPKIRAVKGSNSLIRSQSLLSMAGGMAMTMISARFSPKQHRESS